MDVRAAYAILSLAPGAPEAVVRAAYKAMARITHPDAGGSKERFQQVERAFAVVAAASFVSERGGVNGRTHGHRGAVVQTVSSERTYHDAEVWPAPSSKVRCPELEKELRRLRGGRAQTKSVSIRPLDALPEWRHPCRSCNPPLRARP